MSKFSPRLPADHRTLRTPHDHHRQTQSSRPRIRDVLPARHVPHAPVSLRLPRPSPLPTRSITSRSTSWTAILIRRAPCRSIPPHSANWLLPLRPSALSSPSWSAPSPVAATRYRRRAPLGSLPHRPTAHHPRHRASGLQRAGHGDDHRRKPPARRPQRHGAGPRVRAPGPRIRT